MPVQPFTSFSQLVDGRLLRSLSAQGFTHPTPIQSAVLPLAINDNKDILARARTGSGKTLAYGIPVVQKILGAKSKLNSPAHELHAATRSLVLVPTRELAEQITAHLKTLCQFLNGQDAVKIVNIAGQGQTAKGKSSADKVQK